MEAATQRVHSASWREKRTNYNPTPNIRAHLRSVGTGAQVLYQPPRYQHCSPPGQRDNITTTNIGSEDGDSRANLDFELDKYLMYYDYQGVVMSTEEASRQRSCYPPRSYSRSTVKRETLPMSTSPAVVKSEKDSLLQSLCTAQVLTCDQPLNLQQQLFVPAAQQQQQLLIKSEHTALNRLIVPTQQQQHRTIATSPSLAATVKNEDDLCHSTTTSPGLTTDLENFQDLTEWCRRQPPSKIMDAMEALPETDELNTPLIEHGEEFLFTSPTILNAHNNNITQDDDGDDCYGLLCVQPSDFVTDFYACADIQSAVTHDNVLFDYDSPAADNQQQQQQQYFINDIGGGVTTKTDDHVLNYTTSGTTMDNSFNIFTTHAIPAATTLQGAGESKCDDVLYNPTTTTEQAATTTISNSNCFNQQQAMFSEQKTELSFQFTAAAAASLGMESATQESKKNLRLDFSNLWMDSKTVEQQPTIDTPEVINTALAMENTGFNLVKFINDSIVSDEPSLSAPALEDDVDEQSQSASTSNDPTYTTTDVSDDEDYEPPWNKRAKLNSSRSTKKPAKTKTVDLSCLLKRDSCDSELSNVSSTVEKVVRRGRPPKRNISISSESTNAETEVSRYRELRDKNNEASRRSRLNRKMKEQHLEQEAAGLETRNRKLKVRVTELEKLVNSMRNNLMQMLLKK